MDIRLLLIATDQAATIIETIATRCTHVTVVPVTTPAALIRAVMSRPYIAICLQSPLPWATAPSLLPFLAEWLPTCPLIIFAPNDQIRMLHLPRPGRVGVVPIPAPIPVA